MRIDLTVTRDDFGPALDRGAWTAIATHAGKDVEVDPDGTVSFSTEAGVLGWARTRVASSDGSASATASAESDFPYFGWLFRPIIVHQTRKSLCHLLDVGIAVREGRDPPPGPKSIPWLPNTVWTSDQVRSVASATVALAIVAYCASLIGTATNAFTESFGMTDSELALLLGITRIGTLVALVGAWLADRAGRRQVLLASLVALVILTVLSGLAPDAAWFGALQVLARGLVNLAGPVAAIIVIEESPERVRASTLAIVFLGGALGGVIANLFLPTLDIGPEAWRGMFLAAGLILVLILHLAGRLPETRRFTELAARKARTGRISEVVDRSYRRRFAIIAASASLLNFAAAPTSQLTLRYLQNERDFSGSEVLLLRAVTTAVPGIIAVLVGGVMAETRGRIVVVRAGLFVAGIADFLFFTTGAPWLWVFTAVGAVGGGFAAPAYGAVSNELFPTEVRGTAQAGALATAVAGSILGLLFVGLVRGPTGSIGTAIALTDIAPLIVVLFLYGRLPESRGRDLDDISPTEV